MRGGDTWAELGRQASEHYPFLAVFDVGKQTWHFQGNRDPVLDASRQEPRLSG